MARFILDIANQDKQNIKHIMENICNYLDTKYKVPITVNCISENNHNQFLECDFKNQELVTKLKHLNNKL